MELFEDIKDENLKTIGFKIFEGSDFDESFEGFEDNFILSGDIKIEVEKSESSKDSEEDYVLQQFNFEAINMKQVLETFCEDSNQLWCPIKLENEENNSPNNVTAINSVPQWLSQKIEHSEFPRVLLRKIDCNQIEVLRNCCKDSNKLKNRIKLEDEGDGAQHNDIDENSQQLFQRIEESKFPKIVLKKIDSDKIIEMRRSMKNGPVKLPRNNLNPPAADVENDIGNLKEINEFCGKITRIGGDLKKFRCSICSYETRNKYLLRQHFPIHSDTKVLKCSSCSFKTNRKCYLKRHSKLRHNIIDSETKSLRCSLCSYETRVGHYLKRHIQLVHNKIKVFKCSSCSYETNLKDKLRQHLLVHNSDKLFKCSTCSYGSNYKEIFKSHLLNHMNFKKYKCFQCDFGANLKSALKKHYVIHSDTRSFQCSQCSFKSKHKRSLWIHSMTHVGKNIRCSKCDFTCSYTSYLKRHMLSHETGKSFQCSECDYATNVKAYFKKHVPKHSDIKLKCSQCNYVTNSKPYLQRHVVKHSDKKFKCPQCDYKAKRKRCLKIHMMKIHSNVIC